MMPSKGVKNRRSTQTDGAGAATAVARALRDELSKIEAEPLLPIEKKLIGWSLGIGVSLLIILTIVNHFYPAAP
jgi:hypothetical protein